MAHYRFQILGPSGEVEHAIDLECETEQEAVSAIVRHRGHEALELWEGERLVAKFPAIKDMSMPT